MSSPMRAIVVAAAFCIACGRDGHAVDHAVPPVDRQSRDPGAREAAPSGAAPGACGHAACGDDYFVDAVPAAGCAVGGTCAVALTLVATGEYHINDAYPYAFKAEVDPGVEFLGAGEGKTVFSRASDWTKNDDKTGTMRVAFTPRALVPPQAGASIAGVFKLSVCSAQNCRLERPAIRAVVALR